MSKNGKAAETDGVPAEASKVDITSTIDITHSLFDKVWDKKEVPGQWQEGLLTKLPKSGNLRNCDNYRGIMQLLISEKVFSRILLD